MQVKYKVTASDKVQTFTDWTSASNYAKMLLSQGYSEVVMSITA